MQTRVRVERNLDAAAALETGTRKFMLDGGRIGVNKARDEAPVGATGFLQNQGFFGPRAEGNAVVWGNQADYAEHVEKGIRPHWAPIAPLRRWARRVLGDESAAYAVQRKIAEEGTEGQHFVEAGVQEMITWFAAHDPADYLEDAL